MKSGSTWTYTFLDCTTVDNTLKLWDLTTATELKTLTGHTDYINAIAITWDGQRALCADLESGAIASFNLILLHRCVHWSRFLTARRDRATNINFLRDRRQGEFAEFQQLKVDGRSHKKT